jgi:YD repeat-containing protein
MSNKIKSETIYRYDHIPGEEIDLETEFDQVQSYREFDEAENLVLEIAYTQNGDVTDKIEYRYSRDGLLVETIVFGEDDEILERKEVERETNGRINRELTHYLDGSTDIQEYFYNETGQLTGMRVKDDDDEIEYGEQYFYEGAKLVKVERRDGDGKLIFTQEETYANGVISARKIWSAEEDEAFTLVVEFNAAGHRVQEMRYDGNEELIERNKYEEGGNGRVIRIIEENRQRMNTTEFSYDESGNVILQVETDLNGDLNHKVYRYYDPDGNPLITTVEAVMKPSGIVRAYSLVYRRERY